MIEKIFIGANTLLEDSFQLGLKVIESEFRPTFIIGVWRGGAPVGIAVQEVLERCGCETEHFAIRTSSYRSDFSQSDEVKVYGLQHVEEVINAEDNLLIVDDVFDSGRSIKAIIEKLKLKCRRNTPKNIKIATVYYKPLKNKTDRIPDYYISETDKWLVFPHELLGCSFEEIEDHKPIPQSLIDIMKQSTN